MFPESQNYYLFDFIVNHKWETRTESAGKQVMTPLLLHELSHIIMYVLFDMPFLNPMILPLCVLRYSKRILMHHIYKGCVQEA